MNPMSIFRSVPARPPPLLASSPPGIRNSNALLSGAGVVAVSNGETHQKETDEPVMGLQPSPSRGLGPENKTHIPPPPPTRMLPLRRPSPARPQLGAHLGFDAEGPPLEIPRDLPTPTSAPRLRLLRRLWDALPPRLERTASPPHPPPAPRSAPPSLSTEMDPRVPLPVLLPPAHRLGDALLLLSLGTLNLPGRARPRVLRARAVVEK